jgi:hypothetical protein
MGDDEDEDDLLEAHYAQMDEDDEQPQEEEVTVSQAPTAPTSGESTPGVDSVMVMGKSARRLIRRQLNKQSTVCPSLLARLTMMMKRT